MCQLSNCHWVEWDRSLSAYFRPPRVGRKVKCFSFQPVAGECSIIMWTVPLFSSHNFNIYSDFGRMSQIWLPPFAVSGWFEEQVLWGVVCNLLLWVKSETRQQRKGMGNSLKAPCPADPRPLLIVVCHAAC